VTRHALAFLRLFHGLARSLSRRGLPYPLQIMSKNLDDELAKAIETTDERAHVHPKSPPLPDENGVLPGRASSKRSMGLLITLLAMVAAVLALVFLGFKDSAIYAVGVDKIVVTKELVGRKVRVEGELVPGTLARRDQPCEYRFTVHGESAQLP